MKVCFVCRGYPGLGKVVGAFALHRMFGERVKSYDALFLSYLSGLEFLTNQSCPVVDLLAQTPHFGPGRFCAPLGPETEILVDVLNDFTPDFVVIDGEPYLIDVVRELLGIPTVVLAHPLDLLNSNNSDIGIASFRYFYSKADCVIAHGMLPLPEEALEIGGRAGRVFQTNTIVRSLPAESVEADSLVAILGGGCSNSSELFAQKTELLGSWTVEACNELRLPLARVFCANESIYQKLSGIKSSFTELELFRSVIDNGRQLAKADFVVGRSGRNLMSEFVVLGKRGLVVPCSGSKYRASGQLTAAKEACLLNPNLHLAELDNGYSAFLRMMERAVTTATRPVNWIPGNEEAYGILGERLLAGF